MRQIADVMRVNVQLIATETGAHVWSDQFETARGDGSSGIDELVAKITGGVTRGLVDYEAARGARERPNKPNASDLVLQARSLQYKPDTPDQNARMTALYERAVELDPSSATALSGLAKALLDRLSFYLPEDPSFPEIVRRAEALVTQAEMFRSSDIKVMSSRGFLLYREQRYGELSPTAQRTLSAFPSAAGPRLWLAICLEANGRTVDAIPLLEEEIRVNGRAPTIFSTYANLGFALAFLGRYDEAIPWFHRTIAANPSSRWRSFMLPALAATEALAGHAGQARTDAAEASRR